jgi:GMP reductase
MGVAEVEINKFKDVHSRTPIKKVCVEVANGYIPDLLRCIEKIRKSVPDAVIMAGSVCTPEGTVRLIEAGADIVRVGIGSGSVCITRKVTGIGYPQFSAVLECAAAAREQGGYVCSDGGCTVAGDICKAFGAGAGFVMLGGMLAGHRECNGKIKYKKKGAKTVPASMQFYGMASEVALNKHFGGLAGYRTAEGKVVEVPFRGFVKTTMTEIVGGVRSMMTYIDAPSLADVSSKADFIKVNSQLNTVFGA